MMNGTVGALLFRMSHEGLSGALRIETEDGQAVVVVRSGKVLAVEGVPDLLDTLKDRLPDASALSGELLSDIPICMALGLGLDEVFNAACTGLGAFLAENDADDALFDPTAKPPAGSFPLPKALLRLYIDAVTASDPDSIAQAYRGRSLETLRVMVRPEEAAGLGPIVLRNLRAAWKCGNLGEFITTAGTSPKRLRQTWTSLDLLERMGLVQLGDGDAPNPAAATPGPEAEAPEPRAREPQPSAEEAAAPESEPFESPDYAFDFDEPEEEEEEEETDEPSVLASLDAGGDEVFALGSSEDEDESDFDEDSEDEDSEDDDSEDDDDFSLEDLGDDDSEDEEEFEAEYGEELSELESDDEASDVFAMDSWDDEDFDEDDEFEDEDDEDSEDDGDQPSAVTVVEDDEDDDDDATGDDNPLAALMGHKDPAVKAMALFYGELLRAGPLAPLGLKDEDLVGYLTLEVLRMRANRALGRWHPELHRHRSEDAQQAAMELYKLVESRFEAMSSLESLARAIAELRRSRPWPRPSQQALRKAEIFYRRAQKLQKANAWPAVLVLVGKAVELAPPVARYRVLDLRARTVLMEMSAESGVVNLDALPTRVADRATIDYTAGLIWEDASRPARALSRYERALTRDPDHEEAAWRREQLLAEGAGEDSGASFVGLLSGLFRGR